MHSAVVGSGEAVVVGGGRVVAVVVVVVVVVGAGRAVGAGAGRAVAGTTARVVEGMIVVEGAVVVAGTTPASPPHAATANKTAVNALLTAPVQHTGVATVGRPDLTPSLS